MPAARHNPKNGPATRERPGAWSEPDEEVRTMKKVAASRRQEMIGSRCVACLTKDVTLRWPRGAQGPMCSKCIKSAKQIMQELTESPDTIERDVRALCAQQRPASFLLVPGGTPSPPSPPPVWRT